MNKNLDPAVLRSPQFDTRTMTVHEVKAKRKVGKKAPEQKTESNETTSPDAGKGKGKGKKGSGRRK
jgi:hypothetical protein